MAKVVARESTRDSMFATASSSVREKCVCGRKSVVLMAGLFVKLLTCAVDDNIRWEHENGYFLAVNFVFGFIQLLIILRFADYGNDSASTCLMMLAECYY